MKLMEYTFADRQERMKLLKDQDFDRYFNALEVSTEERRRIARTLMYAAYMHGCIMIDKGRSQWYYLHKAWKYGNDLQLTTWDEYGPVSDLRIRDADDFSYLMNGTVTAYAE